MAVACDRCGGVYGAESFVSTTHSAEARCPACGRASEAALWHVAAGETILGPYDSEQLRESWRTGAIASEHYVHRTGWSEWRRASEVEELRARAHASAPPAQLPSLRRPIDADDPPARREVLTEVFGAPLKGPVMGHDPFHDESLGEAPVAAGPESSAKERWSDPSAAWDLDNMPALDGLLAPGRTSASGLAASAEAQDRAEIVNVSSALAAAASFAPAAVARPVGAPAPQEETVVRSAPRARPNAAGLASGVGAARIPSGYIKGRPPVLTGLALSALCVVVASVVAWALGGKAVSDPENASAQTSMEPPPSPAQAIAAPPSAPSDVATTAHALREANVAAPVPSTPPAALPSQSAAARPGSVAEVAPVAADQGEDHPGARPEPAVARAEAVAQARALRLERRAAAREARAERRKARLLAKNKGRRVSARLAGVSRSGRKAARPADPMEDASSPSEVSAAPAKRIAKSDESLDALVEGAISGGKARAAKPVPSTVAEPEADLPATPTREEMLSAIGKARNLVGRCKGPGTATASIHVKGPLGRATRVEIEGVSGDARSCVETAIRKTPFPKFQQTDFAVRAPFKLGES